MKHIIFVAGMALVLAYPAQAAEEKKPETKKVCVDVKDKEGKPMKNKDGSVKQNCKEVKQHKKHEGTKVPDKK
jgi:azurin